MIANKLDKANKFVKENKKNLNTKYRLNYHFMGEYGWINDPNGFNYYNGEYHLFYQYHPYGSVWGPMHWGHSISKDLIKWEYMPIAMAPDSDFDNWGCFSGSSIVKDDRLYLVYTGCHEEKADNIIQTQGISVSDDDRAITFTKYKNNPVIGTEQIPESASKKDFRDPKVFKRGDSYYMILGSNDNFGNGQALMYKSKDLIYWDFVNIVAKSNGHMGKMWECPDVIFFENKDVFIVSPQYMEAQGNDFNNVHSSIYMIGNLELDKGLFDYSTYKALDYGFDFYAPQTLRNEQGKNILMAWMDMWESINPTNTNSHNWAGAMTIPREIVINGDELHFKPFEKIKEHRKNEVIVKDIVLTEEKRLDIYGDSYELQAVFDAQEAYEFGLKLRVSDTEETVIEYNVKEKLISLNRDNSGIGPKGIRKTDINLIENKLKLNIFVDKSSIEVFINDGEKVMTGRIYPSSESVNIKAFSIGKCKIETLKKWDLL